MSVELAGLRAAVRRFLETYDYEAGCDSWMRGFDPGFSRALAAQGWVGMTVPPEYGGRGRPFVERFVVTEELLRAGAPVAAHWIADRQIAPILALHGNERLRDELLPGICRGELSFCVGMSEPDAGSDVAAIATSAKRDGDRWVVNGQKLWTTGARDAHYCYLIARTSVDEDRRHAGLSEFVVPMDAPGLVVRPIADICGEQHFAEVFFDEVTLDPWRMVGEPGGAFKQVIRQLDYERSGPERILSTYPLFECMISYESTPERPWFEAEVGRLAARFAALRRMSLALAAAMDRGHPPSALTALVKDAGTALEQDVVRVAVELLDVEPHVLGGDGEPPAESNARLARQLADAIRFAPAFTLRGGTSEILREVVARRMLRLGAAG
jgi:acyl-CoA dehydrogenase